MSNIDTSGSPFDFKGTTYVALAPVVRQMGGEIEWDNMAKTAFVNINGQSLSIQMANEVVTVDGRQMRLTSPPLVIDDTLIVPRSFFADILQQPL